MLSKCNASLAFHIAISNIFHIQLLSLLNSSDPVCSNTNLLFISSYPETDRQHCRTKIVFMKQLIVKYIQPVARAEVFKKY